MGHPSENVEVLAAIRSALASGIDVEDLLEQVIPRVGETEHESGFGSQLRRLGQPDAGSGGAESVRRIADGLDRFAAQVAVAALTLDDDELTAIGEQARDWGRALWESEIGVDHAYNQLRHALVELCRRRASLLTGRQLDSLR